METLFLTQAPLFHLASIYIHRILLGWSTECAKMDKRDRNLDPTYVKSTTLLWLYIEINPDNNFFFWVIDQCDTKA